MKHSRLVLLLVLQILVQPLGADEFIPTVINFDQEEILNDIDSLANPFVSKLPIPKIEKLPESTKSTPTIAKPEMVKLQEPEIKLPSFTISGLVWNSPTPQAIVNQRIVKIGDTIDEWTIVGIKETGIEILLKGKKIFIAANFDNNKM